MLIIIVIVLLLGVISYAFLLRPALNSYVIKSQNQGVQYALLSIMQQAATCQTVPLTFGNQTINIVAVECLQQPQQPQQ